MKPGYAAVFIALLVLVVGGMDRDDAEIAEASRNEHLASMVGKAGAEFAATLHDDAPRTRLSIPLGFKAIVCQSDYGAEPECVFYFGKRK